MSSSASSASAASGKTPPSGGMSSKIMGLKFMQRQAQRTGGASATSQAAPAATTSSTAAAAAAAAPAAPSEARWTLPGAAAAEASHNDVRVLTDETAPVPEGPAAVLRFKPGRRSFGNFNPRLEKRLGELAKEKAAAAAELAAAAAAEEERTRREAERAALHAKADAHEAVERQNGVSDSDMASHYAKYAKYIKPKERVVEPPEVNNPIHVRDVARPIPAVSGGGLGGGGGSGGASGKRAMTKPGQPQKKHKR